MLVLFSFNLFMLGLEDLCKRRDEIQRQITADETERTRLQREIDKFTENLNKVNDSLQRKLILRNDLDRTIAESEAAYMKVFQLLNKYTWIYLDP